MTAILIRTFFTLTPTPFKLELFLTEFSLEPLIQSVIGQLIAMDGGYLAQGL
jgi:hypothetical protein